MADLGEVLGAHPPPEFADLPPEHRQRLAALLAGARDRRAAALADAIGKSLHHLPPLLRGTVRRALGL